MWRQTNRSSKLSDMELPISGSVWRQKKLSWDRDEGGQKLPDDQIKGLLCFGASRITITKMFVSEFRITCDKHGAAAQKLNKHNLLGFEVLKVGAGK